MDRRSMDRRSMDRRSMDRRRASRAAVDELMAGGLQNVQRALFCW
jgi:hypothetical protein